MKRKTNQSKNKKSNVDKTQNLWEMELLFKRQQQSWVHFNMTDKEYQVRGTISTENTRNNIFLYSVKSQKQNYTLVYSIQTQSHQK